MRHPDDAEQLQAEMDKWNPMIQKLSTDFFEYMDDDTQLKLLGYIFHIMRDQPDHNLADLTFTQLEEAENAYYERINNPRVYIDPQPQRLRNLESSIPDWPPHATIKPWDDGSYSIIELLSGFELEEEGSILAHCVGSYENACLSRETSIWSLQQNGKRWATIQVNDMCIIQAKARFNAEVSSEHTEVIIEWAIENDIEIEHYY